jgi:hypothetical protein
MIELSLILPAHNEAENLPLLIPELYSVLNTQLELSNEQFQIIGGKRRLDRFNGRSA